MLNPGSVGKFPDLLSCFHNSKVKKKSDMIVSQNHIIVHPPNQTSSEGFFTVLYTGLNCIMKSCFKIRVS